MSAVLLLTVSVLFSMYTCIRNERPVFEVRKKAEITGVVSSKPKEQPDKSRTTLMLDDITIDGREMRFSAYVYLYGSAEIPYEYGQKLSFTASSCWLPDGVTNPGGFDFGQYLWRKGAAVCASVSSKDVTVEEGENSAARILYRLSDRMSERIDDVYGKNADVMKALLIGDRASLSDDTYEDFRIAGIAHLVALSGLHVSCIAMIINAVLRCFFLPKRVRGVLTVVILSAYAVMTGAGPSILRAVFMYAYYVAASEAGYRSDVLTSLSFACILQLLINPLMIEDAGMQMSYLSVLSLLMLSDGMKLFRRFEKGGGFLKRAADGAVTSASASLAVQTGTMPALASLFHSMPVLSIPVNLIAIPLGLITVYLGAASLIVSCISVPAARIFALPSEWIWTTVKRLTGIIAQIPFATVNARPWNIAWILLFFMLIPLASGYFVKRINIRRCVCCALAVFSIAVIAWPAPKRSGLTIVFLDAGYADACVVYAGNDAYVVDTGKDNSICADYLTYSGARVKGVFVTHPDSDHAGGLKEIRARYPKAKIYVSECWERMDVSSTTQGALNGADMVYLARGDEFYLSDGVCVRVLWPDAGYMPKEDNDGSLCLKIAYGEKSAVLLGDLTDKEDYNIQADGDILKVAHHGSKYATTEEMLSFVTPDIAVISVASNGHGHPTPEVLERLRAVGADILRTDECGAITIHIDENGFIDISTILSGGRLAS